MILVHDCNGNFEPLGDPAAFIARIAAGEADDWRGETGQVALEHRGSDGSAWLFLSLVTEGRYSLFSQCLSGERIHAVDPDGDPDAAYEVVVGGRRTTIAGTASVPAATAIAAAEYFIFQDGLLTPEVHWRLNDAPYWPEF